MDDFRDDEAAARERENAEKQLLLDYRFVMDSEAGRRVLWHLLTVLRPSGPVFDTNGLAMASKAARADAAREIEGILAAVSVGHLQLMERENL